MEGQQLQSVMPAIPRVPHMCVHGQIHTTSEKKESDYANAPHPAVLQIA